MESWFVVTEGNFSKFSFPRGQNYLLLIDRLAKTLAPDWLSTPALHFVGFFILCPKTASSFRFFGVRLFKPSCLCHKYMEIKCCS